MNSFDLWMMAKSDPILSKCFIGVFARNELPIISKLPCAFIMNTEKHYEDGEHWLAFYFDQNKQAIFFDPTGKNADYFGLEDYLKKQAVSWIYNKFRIQSYFSENCGQICLFFLLKICRDNSLKKFVNLFSSDYIKNEKFILKNLKLELF
jgi:hypothetical protein